MPNGYRIDLFKGVNSVKKEYDMRYNPDEGISGVHFKANGKSFLLYANGSLCAYGNFSQKDKELAFKRFWNKNKPFFLTKQNSTIHI